MADRSTDFVPLTEAESEALDVLCPFASGHRCPNSPPCPTNYDRVCVVGETEEADRG